MTITAIKLPIEKITEFCDHWQVTEFALFGLSCRRFRPDSDIDVMVQFHPDAHPYYSAAEIRWKQNSKPFSIETLT